MCKELMMKLQVEEINHKYFGKAYINGIPATDEDMRTFEQMLKSGVISAKGFVHNGCICYETN